MRLRSSDRKFCFYVGLTYLNTEMRGKQILQYFMYDILRVCLEWCKEQELYYLTKGPYLNDVYTIFGILDPLPPLVYILARSIRLNPRNLPYYVCISLTPLPLSVDVI